MNKTKLWAECKRILPLILTFAALFAAVWLLASNAMKDASYTATEAQKLLYPYGLALLIAGLGTLWLGIQLRRFDHGEPVGRAFYPVLSALLALVGMSLAYVWVGMWPIGSNTGMIVDMHHQYAPLLAELRDTLMNGDSLLYTFDVGLGASYLPLIGYYLASPFNVLLLLFPDYLLAESILIITLLKNMLTAALFCLAVQYIYGKRNYATVAVALMYSMMTYLLAYSWNVMWLDCVMVLPLVVMGFERMMRSGKCLVYVLSLAYALYSNYYIGFMVCVFLVLYFIAYCLRRRRARAELAGSFLRFSLGSLAGGLLAMFILVPVVMALGQTSAAGGDFQEFAANFDLFDLLGRHLYDTSPTIRSGNLPNIYCGVLAAFCIPLFATTKSIRPRRRATYMGLLALLALSMVINNFDLLWHGLHSPNDLPYRFSFVYCFFLLLIAYETLLHIDKLEWKQLGFSLMGVCLYVVVEEKFNVGAYEFESLYISLGLSVVYAGILLLASRRKLLKESAYALLLCVVALEMVTNASGTFVRLDSQEYFTSHNQYVDNDETEAIRDAVAAMEQLGDSEAEGGFYRLEFAPRRTSVDTALFDYNGITVFASSNSYEETRFMGALGYAVNGVNSHLFHNFIPSSDSLLGVRYVALNNDYEPSKYLEARGTVSVGNYTYTIYENELALPLGVVAQSAVKRWNYSYYSPFVSQNGLLSAMTGIDADTYELQKITTKNPSATVAGTYSFSMPIGSTTFEVPITKSGRVYVHVDCRAAETIRVHAHRVGVDALDPTDSSFLSYSQEWSVTTYEPYVIDAGEFSAGDCISVDLTATSSASGNIYVSILNDEVLEQQMAALNENGLQVTSFSDTRIEGTLHSSTIGTVFTSIPYDAGWTVKVDGKTVETYAVGDAMLGFDVTAGEHTVTLTFLPRGFIVGIVLTVLGILLTVALCRVNKLRTLTETGEGMPFDLPDDDVPPLAPAENAEAAEPTEAAGDGEESPQDVAAPDASSEKNTEEQG